MDLRPESVQAMLLRRGLSVARSGLGEGCLLPDPCHLDAYYRMLHRYSFRLFLRDVIKHRERVTAAGTARYTGLRTAAEYVDRLLSLGLLQPAGGACRLAPRTVTGFGSTLEWYVSEVLRREMLAQTAVNVRFRAPGPGGDYDVLAGLGDRLLYVEAKSSPPKQIPAAEVAAFLRRCLALGPEIAVFVVDTRLRMRDKIVPLFDDELRRLPAAPALTPLAREIYGAGGRLFVANAQPGIAANLATILRAYHAGRPLL